MKDDIKNMEKLIDMLEDGRRCAECLAQLGAGIID